MSQNKYPHSLPFLCHVISERQKFNKIRLSASQKGSYIYHDGVFRMAKKEHQKKIQRLSEEFNKLYEQIKPICKDYSKIITEVRKGMKCKLHWGSTNNVEGITMQDNTYINSADFEKMSKSYVMDEMLFPELKVQLPHDIEPYQKKYNALNHVTKEFRKNVKSEY